MRVLSRTFLIAVATSTLLAAAVSCLLMPTAIAKTSASADRRQLTQEKNTLQGQISTIRREISDKEKRLNTINEELQKSEQSISHSNRTLRSLADQKKAIEAQIADLKNEGQLVGRDVKEADKDLTQISKAQFVNARRHPWQSLLVGNNPNEIRRLSGFLSYLERERNRTVHMLTDRQRMIADNIRKTTEKRSELARVEVAEKKNREQLQKEQNSRETARANLMQALNTQRERYEQLVKNERELTKLISDIDTRIAENEKKEKARQLALRKKAEEERRQKTESAQRRKNNTRTEPVVIASPNVNFNQMKGRLTMPASGTIAARFGQKRTGAASSLSWRGLLIRAKTGNNVVAAAPGTVVFSDWMRGFGNLLIVDHGSNYLSVYANNETLYKSVGEKVKQGETIASIGNSGGEELPGLYFELRRHGTPIDPLPWLARH